MSMLLYTTLSILLLTTLAILLYTAHAAVHCPYCYTLSSIQLYTEMQICGESLLVSADDIWNSAKKNDKEKKKERKG